MKITLSRSQWEQVGRKAGWDRGNNSTKQLIDMIQQIDKMQNDFRSISSNLPKDQWSLIGKDCDEIAQYLENAAGRISTLIHKMK